MPLLGAHMSIAGGYYKAIEAAAQLEMDCVQIFTKNSNQWRAKPLTEDDVRRFRDALEQTGVQMPCAHDSYLINLASPDDVLWRKSLEAIIVELQRANSFRLFGVVVHPGSYVDSGEEQGLNRIVKAIDVVHRRTDGIETKVLLETTAGQGTSLGCRFEHLAYIINNVVESDRLGVCIDSCHLFAAGYPLGSSDDYAATMAEFDRIVGIDRVCAFHLNDSKQELGSRIDRHEKIGAGHLGLKPFRYILNDPRFAHLPMYLETPKGETNHQKLDAINLATLRSLLSKNVRSRRSQD